jgi:hypothetical protein
MEAIISSVISLANQYLTKKVDTGDKLFDTSVLAILTTLCALVIRWFYELFTHIDTYNKCRYWYNYYIKKQRDPLVLNTQDYKYNFTKIEKYHKIFLDSLGTSSDRVRKEQMQSFLRKYLEKDRGMLENSAGYLKFDGRRFSCSSANSFPNFPVFYDGVDMIFCYCDDASFPYVFGQTKAALAKFFAYVQIRMQEEQDKTNVKEQDRVCLYEYRPQNGSEYSFHFISNLSPNKRFENIFYDQKQTLISVLEKFSKGHLYPSQICMDNKLGILLYGPPGTGKTGTICAIANMLQRSVVFINFAKVTKRSELDNLLQEKYYNKYIFVFDEFDCILDVLVNKTEAKTKNVLAQDKHRSNIRWSELIKASEGEDKKKITDMMLAEIKEKQTDDRIDMAYLLQKLDGLEYAQNRLIIATTNNPEYINPVLLRPGRFDLKLELGNCSQQMYVDILQSFFKLDGKAVQTVQKANLPTKKWSPLQVINTALVTNDLQKTLRQLKDN